MKVTFTGNCHADVLCRVLRHSYRDQPDLDAVFIRNYAALDEADHARIAASDLVVSQTADFASTAGPVGQGRARLLQFPLLLGQFLWPFNTRDHPRLGQTLAGCGDPNFFTFPITDGQVVKLMKARDIGPHSPGAEIERLLDDYMTLDYATLTNLGRQLDFSREKMRRAADIVGYDLWPPIERDFRSVQTFVTALHPAPAVMQALCREVLPRCGFPVTDAQILDALDAAYEGDAPFAFEAPIHPSVIRHFGLNIPGDPPAYRFWCEGTITARDMARRIVTSDARQPVRDALGLGQGDLPPGEQLGQLAALAPAQCHNPTFLLRYGNLLAQAGRLDDALRTYAAGLQVAPFHTGLARRVAAGLAAQTSPPPIVGGAETIGFGTNEAGRALATGPWNGNIDHDGVWLGGNSAGLQFRLAPALHGARAVDLAFRASAFGGPATHMQARVYANGREVALWSFGCGMDNGLHRVRLDPALARAPSIKLNFHVDRMVRPIDLGLSQDTRSFGIGISRMTVSAD